ncbi:MAG: iron ABC transporter permease [Coriobacteriales bacterium]|nr:iron ABC transporter permease [Coriobacteriales bacterium]
MTMHEGETRTGQPQASVHDPRRVVRARWVIILLVASLLLALAANLCLGSVRVPLDEIVPILLGAHRGETAYQVIWNIRLPRLLAAALLGGALALSGLLLQTLFSNPIAGPYVLGISNGAKLAVAFVMIMVVGDVAIMTSWMSMLAAFMGSLAVMAAVLVISRHVRSAGTLVIAGVMIGYICSAATDLLVTFASDANIANLRNWSQGSFSGINAEQVVAITVVVAVASACVFLISKPLGAFQLGESYAQSVGVDVPTFRIVVILLSSVLAASVTAFAGPISFVGVAVPHVARRLLGTSKPLLVVPVTFLAGSVACLLCDLLARSLFAPIEMSVSTVTAIFGAPIVIWVLLSRKGREV